MNHFQISPELTSDNPVAGTGLTIILALSSITTTGMSFIDGIHSFLAIIAQLVAISAGIASILVCLHTIKSKKDKKKKSE